MAVKQNAATIKQGKRIENILAQVKPLAAEFYRLAGKPLGVTGEIAEYVAAKRFNLRLVPARTCGFDALRGDERIQIKGRAYDPKSRKSQRMSRIKTNSPCDTVMLVLPDNASLDAKQIWEAPFLAVKTELEKPGSKSRNERGALSVGSFNRIGHLVWSDA